MTNETQQARRAAFEAWAAEESEVRQVGETIGLLQDEHHNRYSMIWTQTAWMAWNAALDSLVIALPRCRMYPPNEASSDVDYWIDEAKSTAISQCRDAIHAAGVKTR